MTEGPRKWALPRGTGGRPRLTRPGQAGRIAQKLWRSVTVALRGAPGRFRLGLVPWAETM